jgi:hypothetical protein
MKPFSNKTGTKQHRRKIERVQIALTSSYHDPFSPPPTPIDLPERASERVANLRSSLLLLATPPWRQCAGLWQPEGKGTVPKALGLNPNPNLNPSPNPILNPSPNSNPYF